MEPIEFITPSGHQVYLKPHLTYGDKRDLERVFAKATVVDPQTKEVAFDSASIYDAQDLAVKRMVVRLVTKSHPIIETDVPEAILSAILAMPEEDGKAIFDKVEELTKATQLSTEQKKT